MRRFRPWRTIRPALVAFTLAAIAANAAESGRSPARTIQFNVQDFGAVGDGETKNTKAIQAAVDAANEQGGGTVVVPPGTYLTGTIRLKSNVALYLDTGAVILGSTNLEDYPHISPKIRSYTDNYADQSILYAEGVDNVAVLGNGTIDGQGASFTSRTYKNRPYIIRMFSSKDIRVEDVTLLHSPMWVQHYLDCEDVTLRGLTVLSRVNRNNDMIDIDGCRNVRISDCYGVTGDDTITLKSTFDRPCENVSITNCVVSSHCNGIKMGTETNGGFRNIAISNCTIFDTGLAGIALEIVDGGTMDGVTISNVSMNGVRAPIFMRLGNRARKFKDDMETPEVGVMKNVTIDNVTATNATKLGCAISGLPGHPIRDVTLSNIRLRFAGGGARDDALREVPEKPDTYPECTMFGTLPAYGFHCRHVEGIRFDGIDVAWEESDERPAMVFDDVAGLEIESLRAKAPAGDLPVLMMTDVAKAIVRGCVAPEGSGTLLGLRGQCSGISLVGNDLGAAKQMVEFGEGVDPNVLFDEANRKRK